MTHLHASFGLSGLPLPVSDALQAQLTRRDRRRNQNALHETFIAELAALPDGGALLLPANHGCPTDDWDAVHIPFPQQIGIMPRTESIWLTDLQLHLRGTLTQHETEEEPELSVETPYGTARIGQRVEQLEDLMNQQEAARARVGQLNARELHHGLMALHLRGPQPEFMRLLGPPITPSGLETLRQRTRLRLCVRTGPVRRELSGVSAFHAEEPAYGEYTPGSPEQLGLLSLRPPQPGHRLLAQWLELTETGPVPFELQAGYSPLRLTPEQQHPELL